MRSMHATSRAAPLARGALVALLALMGLALLVTAWTSYRGVLDASSTLVRGQANALQHTVRSRLAELEPPVTSQELAALLEEESGSGLRYLALVTRGGDVEAEAGKALGSSARLPSGPPSEEPWRVGEDRVRVTFGALARRGRAWDRGGERGGFRGRLGLVVMEFEPVEARALRGAARRTFGIGALAATTLGVMGLWLLRWVLRREAQARTREREKRLQSLGEMSAVLAHEIRNPLASLKGNAQLLAQLLPEGEKPRQKAERVVDEALRLESLTNDLLAYVRTGEVHPEPTDPAALLLACAQSAAPAGGVEVESTGAPSSWPLDEARMRQVLVNLLENAVQAGAPAPVKARVTERHGQLVYEVEDQGPGVREEDRERIFEPFYTRRIQGTGLGLAVAKRVVDLHGGALTVENVPAGGALFRVSLPPWRG